MGSRFVKIFLLTIFFIPFSLMFFCAPRVTTKKAEDFEKPKVSHPANDTLSYLINFEDKADRERFMTTFREFLRNYPFATASTDSSQGSVLVKIKPVNESGQNPSQLTVERSKFVQNVIDETIQKVDTASMERPEISDQPARGGNIRILLQRGYIDLPFLSMIDTYPFTDKGSKTKGIIIVTDSSAKDLILKIDGKITDGAGRAVSALDIIQTWANMIKNHPAEGYALFRNVQGIEEFIRGQEAIIRGFGAIDDKTIKIRFATPDPYALERLRTPRLFGDFFKLGPYFTKVRNGKELTLAANNSNPECRPFLDECTIKLNGESNPILSFSLNRYDAIVVTAQSDLSYARQQLANSSKLIPLPTDRYFLSCNTENVQMREYLKASVDPNDLLRNFVKAEGQLIGLIERDSFLASVPTMQKPPPPLLSQPFRIIFKSDDPPSKAIAERIMADLTHAGIKCDLKGTDEKGYESALVMKEYGCAIGYVSSEVISCRSEQLRLGTMWFKDQTDEAIRIQENREIPLFTVQRYLLTKNRVCLYKNDLSGIYVQPDSTQLK